SIHSDTSAWKSCLAASSSFVVIIFVNTPIPIVRTYNDIRLRQKRHLSSSGIRSPATRGPKPPVPPRPVHTPRSGRPPRRRPVRQDNRFYLSRIIRINPHVLLGQIASQKPALRLTHPQVQPD